MIRCAALVLFLAMSSAGYAQTCEQLESKASYAIDTLSFVADQEGELGAMRQAGFEGIRQCPNSQVLWYAALRSAELLGIPPGFAGSKDLSSLALEAVRHAPLSAPVATAASRITGSSDLARKAVALDPHYRPAQRALAIALSKDGQTEEALRLCRVEHPSKEDDLVRGRVLLAAGRISEAINAVQKAIASRVFDLKEPTPAPDLDREAHEVLGFAFLKAGRNSEAAHAFRIAASQGSVPAQEQLTRLK